MRNTLKWIRDRFNNPDIIITENGYSDNSGNLDDMMRVYYYKHNINNVLKGINKLFSNIYRWPLNLK